MNAKNFLYENLKNEFKSTTGLADDNYLINLTNDWMNDANNSTERFKTHQLYFPQANKILDMATGCGTFLFYGLLNGFDVEGVEPEKWKLEFLKKKIIEKNYPLDWEKKIFPSFGENLPFDDEYFDVCSTYQTLEHVSNVQECLVEMLRVTKKGGGLHIICPDYRSTFEGHYRISWLPLFPRPLAKIYLRLRGKNPNYLDTINYVTEKRIRIILNKIATEKNYNIKIINVKKQNYLSHPKVKNSSFLPYLYLVFASKIYLSKLCRSEVQTNMIVLKK